MCVRFAGIGFGKECDCVVSGWEGGVHSRAGGLGLDDFGFEFEPVLPALVDDVLIGVDEVGHFEEDEVVAMLGGVEAFVEFCEFGVGAVVGEECEAFA